MAKKRECVGAYRKLTDNISEYLASEELTADEKIMTTALFILAFEYEQSTYTNLLDWEFIELTGLNLLEIQTALNSLSIRKIVEFKIDIYEATGETERRIYLKKLQSQKKGYKNER